MKKNLFLTILFLIICSCASDDSNNPNENPANTTDSKLNLTYKTVLNNLEIRQMIKTKDNQYIAIAFADDFQVVKFDANFNIIWNKTYGGSKKDYAESIMEDSQGNFLIIGESESSDGDIEHNNGDFDIFSIKIDGNGNLIWRKNYGGSGYEGISQDNAIVETNNGDFILVGFTTSTDFNITNNNGEFDVWVIKIDKSGNILKQKTFGGTSGDYGRKIIKYNNNFLVTLKSNSSNNEFPQNGNWVFNMDNDLNIVWKKNTLGINSGIITANKNNEIIVVNATFTNIELHKIGPGGNIIKSTSYYFPAELQKQPFANQIISTSDDGFIIIGDLGGGNDQDAIVFKINKNLEKVAYQSIAGNNYDKSRSILPLQTNKFIYLINSYSNNLEIPTSGQVSSIVTEIEEK